MNYHSLKFVHSSEIRGLCFDEMFQQNAFFVILLENENPHILHIFLICFAGKFHQALTPFFLKNDLLSRERLFSDRKKNDL